ncbi:Ig-like domain-containing protein [Parahaliea mediterranea]|uniref:DNRLRE domain-containing protein n=1 Tax=Parahaliea mediterranea TaxID=651086 RepID=A0A939IP18_9GAMM|nr:DNRLRE domain-containing protein [Parahaliea mediterranea]
MKAVLRGLLVLALPPVLLADVHDRTAAAPQTDSFVVDLEALGELDAKGFHAATAYRQHGASAYLSDGAGAAELKFNTRLSSQGYYRIHAWWPQVAAPAAGELRYRISHDGGDTVVVRSQQGSAGQWNLLGEFALFSRDSVRIRVQAEVGSAVAVDAFRFEYVGTAASAPQVTTTALAIGRVGEQYRESLLARGGAGDYTWQLLAPLPAGLALDANTGEISGTPRESGVFQLMLYLRDRDGATASAELELRVEAATDGDPALSRPVPRSLARAASTTANAVSESLLDVVAAMPEGSWRKLNENLFSDVWSPAALRPLNKRSNPRPEKIIVAWSSFAWDFLGGRLFLYGGGHANYSGNDVYFWRAATRRWERASLPSEIVQDDFGNWRAIDGVFNAPSSAHTYDNSVFLPVSGQFLTYGGAAYNNGGAFMYQPDANTERPTGPYVFDPAKADGDKVGGTTGSHVQRNGPYPEIGGGEMWSNRDIYGNIAGNPPLPTNFVQGTTATTIEAGRDVVYVMARSGGTARQLYKHTIHDINDPSRDTWEQVGRYFNGFNQQGGGAYSGVLNAYVATAGTQFLYWDLSTPGEQNNNQLFVPEDASGEFESSQLYGFDYYPGGNAFYLWGGYGEVWRLEPPPVLSSSGWAIFRETSGGVPEPQKGPGTGILGKWEFAPDLNAFLALEDAQEGNIWLYKPQGWVEPSLEQNLPPQVVILGPAPGTQFSAGDTVVIEADATDQDGSIERVLFYSGALQIGQDASPPYSLAWENVPAGEHELSARAVDDAGATGVSPPVSITAVASGNQPPAVAITAPPDGDVVPEGQALTITVDASDPDGSVTSVEIYANDELLAALGAPPYSVEWLGAEPGVHMLTAVAGDNEGGSSVSLPVQVTVEAVNLPPDVVLTAPVNGASFDEGDSVSLQAEASDSDGNVARVVFFVNGVELAGDSEAPYGADWVDVRAGSYSLQARAEDDEGALSWSAPVAVQVNSADGSVEVTLQDGVGGYAGTRDTYLSRFYSSSTLGGRDRLQEDEGTYAVLLGFAIFHSEGGPVPDGAAIQSASLSLYKYSSYDHDYQWHRLLLPWSEEGASWSERLPGLPWADAGAAAPGQDYQVVADGGGGVGWSSGWLSIDVTPGVRAMSQGEANHGWRLLPVGGNGNRKRFHSRETSESPALRPRLVVRYAADGVNLPPAVTLSEPVDGAVYNEMDDIPLTALASDPDGSVARVVFYSGGVVLGEALAPPYAMLWRDAPAGTHNLRAEVIDDGGASTMSETVTVTVQSTNLAPEVSLTAPADGANYIAGDTVSLQATAADADGSVTRVVFYQDEEVLAEDTSAPYAYDWTGVPPGSYTLSARAEDDDGAQSVSAAVSITVQTDGSMVELVLQDGVSGYAGTRDTYLSRWHRGSSLGGQARLQEDEGSYAMLMQFAIFQSEGGPVPDGVTIESATLSLYKYTAYDHVYQAHPLLAPWSEEETTWDERLPGSPWAASGAAANGDDYASDPDGSGGVGWSPGWLSIDVTAGVQAISQGASNHGWRLVPVAGNGNRKRYYSRETFEDTTLRPKLHIMYR